ncbi:MAG: glutathione S-transferase family protein [Pseudomonadota bacterium]
MTEIFLHHYDASPFSQKAIKMLAIKGVDWKSVIHPMIAPKPELTVLTGGYRGTPVMQIGADIFVDSQLIAEELERRFPYPSLYLGGKGVAHMLDEWGHAFFRSGLDIAIKEFSGDWDEDFYKDRDAIFPDLDFSKADTRFTDACVRLRAHAQLINDQLSDGRDFLMGASPGLADIQGYVVNWFTRAGFPFVQKLFNDFSYLEPWEKRMAALGEGGRIEATAQDAYDVAKASQTIIQSSVDADDPSGLAVGDEVCVIPVTSQRGDAKGRLVRLSAGEVAIAPSSADLESIVVHYPRLGYEVRRV